MLMGLKAAGMKMSVYMITCLFYRPQKMIVKEAKVAKGC